MPSDQGILDLGSSTFDVDAYMSKLLKEKTLDELVKEEEQMVNNVRRLDSDVHQIVYENYNKFLTATNTVRKIENEFNELDTEMASLSDSMTYISTLVSDLSSVLGDGGKRVATLSRSCRAISGVQFIFDLPNTLQRMLEEKKYSELVQLYVLARKSLQKYSNIESVKLVLQQSQRILKIAEKELESRVVASVESVQAAEEAVDLLLQLGISGEQLRTALLLSAENTLKTDLETLPLHSVDVLELVDSSCSSFLTDLSLCAQLFRTHFQHSNDELMARLLPLLSQLHTKIRNALLSARAHDTALVVRALDRYYRKCGSVSQLLPELSNMEACMELVKAVSAREVELCREKVVSECSSTIHNLRESLLDGATPSPSLVSSLLSSFLLQIKTALAHLLLFTASDVAFSSSFHSSFAMLVHSSLLVVASTDVSSLSVRLGSGDSTQLALTLILALFTHQMVAKTAQLQVLCREQFALSTDAIGPEVEQKIAESWKEAAHTLLANYAHQTALAIGDRWCNALVSCATAASEPRGVSTYTLRMREELRQTDDMVGSLCGEERRKAGATGESSTRREKRTTSTVSGSMLAHTPEVTDSLWSERIDLHAHIHFNKQSILTSIVKRVLKSGVEGLRIKTLTTFGIQQIQVDVGYLQEEISWLTGDIPLLTSLFDQLLSAALRRCTHPKLLHPNFVARLIASTQEEMPSQ